MRRRTIEIGRFLRSVSASEVLREYCEQRGIDFEARHASDSAAVERWQRAVSRLPPERQADVELELSQVQELANRDSIYHLIDVCAGRGLPADLVPGEAAQALWFLVHQPAIFLDVYYHEEVLEGESWESAQGPPGIQIDDPRSRLAALEPELKRFFVVSEGTGRYVASQAHSFDDPPTVLFIGFVSDRLRVLDGFTDRGDHRRYRVRPSVTVTFAYYPADGTVLLQSRHRARDKVLALMNVFARSVLHTEIDAASFGTRFLLDQLMEPFDRPLPEGVVMARVKSLELAYPATEGRRRLRLETNAADAPSAIRQLLARHVDDETARRLRVVSAELQVALLVRGRVKNHVIRLWPNRCSLSQTETADFLRQCLTTWGLIAHAPKF